MSNFSFLLDLPNYAAFASACVDAEKTYATSPPICCMATRRAVELGIKWVFSADTSMNAPPEPKLNTLLHMACFRDEIDSGTWTKLSRLILLGNDSAHTSNKHHKMEALSALMTLFEFVDWIDCCYGSSTETRKFDEKLIPTEKADPALLEKLKSLEALFAEQEAAFAEQEAIFAEKEATFAEQEAVFAEQEEIIAEQKNTLLEKDKEIQSLLEEIQAQATFFTQQKDNPTRQFVPTDFSDFSTRKIFIDVMLHSYGWEMGQDCLEEYEVDDMEGNQGQKGYVDYVLMGKNGIPLAVVEAKRSSKDPVIGKHQGKLYADCLERKFKVRPMIFYTNGFDTYFWDDETYPPRMISFIFSKSDLEKLITRKTIKKNLALQVINDKITDRYYQKEAINSVTQQLTEGNRKYLLVMATGTGKTRTAASLTDVLSRGNHVSNILFLADRKELVRQAMNDFAKYIPSFSRCNLVTDKDGKDAKIVFSTYPTILNAIDSLKNKDGSPLYSPAHFDLIIIDEAHRSIFNIYRSIFEYFDALLLGLTATPKNDVDANTYAFFDIQNKIPTYNYNYETAVEKDKVLVPYYAIETKTKFLEDGIRQADLSSTEQANYKKTFTNLDGKVPKMIASSKLNKFVFNENTVDMVLSDLMSKGIHINGGDMLGKTIIFAQNQEHAKFIVQRFDLLYPQYQGKFANRVVCEDSNAEKVIKNFKKSDSMPQITVSVDMMDTGIDVPEVVNLVFFKTVHSETKFWQMIGRGTRLCEDLSCVDFLDGKYQGKRRFFIFDYCSNFEYFKTKPEVITGTAQPSTTAAIFEQQLRLILALQDGTFASQPYEIWRKSLVSTVVAQILALNKEQVAVRLQLKYKEQYKNESAFECLQESNVLELISTLAPLVYNKERDNKAKEFDHFMYSFINISINKGETFDYNKKKLCKIAQRLEKNAALPQIKLHLSLIKSIQKDSFWNHLDILKLEEIREKLRHLMLLLAEENPKGKPVYTNYQDEFSPSVEGNILDYFYEYEEYRSKVATYFEEFKNQEEIKKIRENQPISQEDYDKFADIFTKELGTEREYAQVFGDTPFGLQVRKITKLERSVVTSIFSQFTKDETSNQQQQDFLEKVIDYLGENGYIEEITELLKAPFDKPMNFTKLFDDDAQQKLVDLITSFKNNAQAPSKSV